VRVAFLVAAAIFGVLSRKALVREVQASLNRKSARLEVNGGKGLSGRDKLGLSGFSICMGLAGRVWYPEVAREHLYLHQRGPKIRRWVSSFPMESDSVRAHLRNYALRLSKARVPMAEIALPEQRFTFDYSRDPMRIALALNPLTIRGKAVKDGDDWVFKVAGVVPVKYPERARVQIPVPHLGTITIEEGLFYALQESGMLHPYLAEYHWHVRASELLAR
jgi:hypothetical protein